MLTFTFPSGANPNKTYTTTIDDTGRLGCTCLGWTMKRNGRVRDCKHTKRVVCDRSLSTVVRGDYLYVVTGTQVPPPVAPPPPAPRVPPPVAPPPPAPRVARPAPAVAPAVLDLFVDPMLAGAVPEGTPISAFATAAYIMETKLDGHRVVVAVTATADGKAVAAWSRPGAGKAALARTLPEHIVSELGDLPVGTYDGELMVPGGKSHDVVNHFNADKLVYVIFDVTRLLGQDTTREPYSQRRAYLAEIFKRAYTMKSVTLAETWPVSQAKIDALMAEGAEGVVIKRVAAIYSPGARSTDWMKVKAVRTTVMTVLGFVAAKNGPHAKVAVRDDDGNETTVKTIDNAMLRRFAANPDSFVGRRLRVEFTEQLQNGSYRHPRFDRFEDE